MAQAAATLDLAIPADRVWALIGGFGSLPDWLPNIPRSELEEGGRVRRLTASDGVVIIERLIAFDHLGRSYSYAILQSPFPVTDYLSTLRVQERNGGSGSRVEWSGRFTPNGVSEEEAASVFQRIYEDGLAALGDRLAPKG
jgi:hypothetical protein